MDILTLKKYLLFIGNSNSVVCPVIFVLFCLFFAKSNSLVFKLGMTASESGTGEGTVLLGN